MDTNENKIDELIKKAAESEISEDAKRFSQSALNCSYAINVLQDMQIRNKEQEAK